MFRRKVVEVVIKSQKKWEIIYFLPNSYVIPSTNCPQKGDGLHFTPQGYRIMDGALWDIQYVDGKGFTLKNLYTKKYLKDNLSAKYDAPTYFSFCTLRYKTTGVGTVLNKKEVNNQETYDLSGRRVDSSNLRPGLYIRGGKKILLP